MFEKKHGRLAPALLAKPDLPWYYNDIFNLYMLLSNQRGKYVLTAHKVIKGQVVPQTKLMPAPVDTNSILLLAQSTGIMKPQDFLNLVSTLDAMFLKKSAEKT